MYLSHVKNVIFHFAVCMPPCQVTLSWQSRIDIKVKGGVGGGFGVTAITQHGGGEVNQGASDEGRREYFQFHTIVLRRERVEASCSNEIDGWHFN